MLERDTLKWEGKIKFFSYEELREYVVYYIAKQYQNSKLEAKLNNEIRIKQTLHKDMQKKAIEDYENYYKNIIDHDTDEIHQAVKEKFALEFENKARRKKMINSTVKFNYEYFSKISVRLLGASVMRDDTAKMFKYTVKVNCKKLTLKIKRITNAKEFPE